MRGQQDHPCTFCDAMEECKEDDSRMMAVAFEEVQPGEIKGLPVLKK
jgi:hypothetical protein